MDIVCYIGQGMQTQRVRSVLHDNTLRIKPFEFKCVLQKVRTFNFGLRKLNNTQYFYNKTKKLQ